jgi:sporulation protein YlmC with PRC-barrel domain
MTARRRRAPRRSRPRALGAGLGRHLAHAADHADHAAGRPVGGTPGARGGANAGSATTQTVPGNNAGAPGGGGQAPDRQVPPNMQGRGHTQGQANEAGSGPSNPGGSVGGTQAPRDNAPGNPPSPNAPDRRSDAGPAATGTVAAEGAAPAAAAGGASLAAVDAASMRDARRASRVIGAAVYNESNESIGEVDDIVLPANGGAPVAVVSVGGFLGIGAKLVAVPYDRLRAAGERNRSTLTGAASRDDLNRLPTFSYDSTAGRADPARRRRRRSFGRSIGGPGATRGRRGSRPFDGAARLRPTSPLPSERPRIPADAGEQLEEHPSP